MSHSRSPFGDWQSYLRSVFKRDAAWSDGPVTNFWVLAYAPLIERWLRSFRKPHCGSLRIDETYMRS
jgi:transposase, IS6 family